MKRIIFSWPVFAVLSALFLTTIDSYSRDSSDGCGLGWEVTSKTSFSATSTRATTNAFVPPTFGMTSGTMGCARHSLVKKKDEPAAFYAIENYDSLRQEMAEGSGENLRAFATLMGCDSKAYPEFSNMVRKHFDTIASDPDTRLDLVIKVRAELDRDPVLGSTCASI
jgi:hypothetical protein